MSDYRSRHLTADGRVCSATHVILFPTKDNSIPSRLFGSWGADCGAPSITHDPVECGVCLPADTWFEGAANTWDATCTTCEGAKGFEGADHSDEPTRWYPCPDCEGTGVDETVPLRLVGAGSIVTPQPDHWKYGKWSGRLLLILLSDRAGWWSTGLYRHGGDPARMETVPTDLSGWQVVRPVPPVLTRLGTGGTS
jgi:hypothetical protein